MNVLPFLAHRETYQRLDGLRRAGRLPHALIFLGPEGVGKRLVARHLARTLLCEEDNAPCNTCRSCLQDAEGRHPDLWVLEPENGRIKIDAIRDLKKTLNLPPLVSKVRVALISEAHTLNVAAANALLKALEEPPPATYFLLASHAAGWVPRTILSRCQKVRLSPLPDEVLGEILRAQGKALDSKRLHLAQGSAKLALLLSESKEDLPSLERLCESSEALGLDEAYALGQSLNDPEKLVPFLEGLLLETHRCLCEDQIPERRFELLAFAERILEFRREMRQNANPKLHLPRLLMFFKEPLESRL